MRLISCHDGKLQTLSSAATELKKGPRDSFVTGLEAIDALAPGGALSRGAMHELLFDPRHGQPNFVAAMFAAAGSSFNIRCSMFNVRCSHFENINIEHPTLNIERRIEDKAMPIIWCDPRGEVYPPALAS